MRKGVGAARCGGAGFRRPERVRHTGPTSGPDPLGTANPEPPHLTTKVFRHVSRPTPSSKRPPTPIRVGAEVAPKPSPPVNIVGSGFGGGLAKPRPPLQSRPKSCSPLAPARHSLRTRRAPELPEGSSQIARASAQAQPILAQLHAPGPISASPAKFDQACSTWKRVLSILGRVGQHLSGIGQVWQTDVA